MDSFFEEDITRELESVGFQIVETPEITSLKTIIVRQIDCSYEHITSQELVTAINCSNSWACALEASFLPTRGKNKIIKIRFNKVSTAIQALYKGIIIVDQSIPPLYIEPEIKINLTPCNKCYQYSHLRRDCNGTAYQGCTKCGMEGHDRNNCKSNQLKCASCKTQGHDTFAKECPTRRKLYRERGSTARNRERNKAVDRYKQIMEYKKKTKYAGNANVDKYFPLNIDPLPAAAHCVILTAVTTASLIESKYPGTFQQNFNDICKSNELTEVVIPDHIIKQLLNLENKKEKRPHSQETATRPETPVGQTTPKSKKYTTPRGYSISPARPESLEKQKKLDIMETDTTLPVIPQPIPAHQAQATEQMPEAGKRKNPSGDRIEKYEKMLKTLKNSKATIFYPKVWRGDDGTFNAKKLLDTLLKTEIFVTYEKKIDNQNVKELIRECHENNLNIRNIVTFTSLTTADYNQLSKGHWSVVGLPSDSDEENG